MIIGVCDNKYEKNNVPESKEVAVQSGEKQIREKIIINTDYANEIFAKNYLELFGIDEFLDKKNSKCYEEVSRIFIDSGWNSRILKKDHECFCRVTYVRRNDR